MQFVSKPPEAPDRWEMHTQRAAGRTQLTAKENVTEAGAGAEPRHGSVSSQPCPKIWDQASLMLRRSHVWKQMISHRHSRAATVPIGTLPIYHAKQRQVFMFTLLGFSHTLQTSHPGFKLNQGLIWKPELILHKSIQPTSPSLDQPLGASSSLILVSSEMSNLSYSLHFDASPRVSSDTSPIPGRTQSFFKPKHLKTKGSTAPGRARTSWPAGPLHLLLATAFQVKAGFHCTAQRQLTL